MQLPRRRSAAFMPLHRGFSGATEYKAEHQAMSPVKRHKSRAPAAYGVRSHQFRKSSNCMVTDSCLVLTHKFSASNKLRFGAFWKSRKDDLCIEHANHT